jgi:hypothetical protein
VDDLAADGLLLRAHHAQLEVAVVEEDPVSALHVAGQRLVGGRDAVGRSLDGLVRGDREPRAVLELDALRVAHAAGADLRPREVLEEGDRLVLALGDRACGLDDLEVAGMVAVREVQAKDVDAGVDQPLERRRVARRGADRGHDLGAAHPGRVYGRRAILPPALPAG